MSITLEIKRGRRKKWRGLVGGFRMPITISIEADFDTLSARLCA